MIGIIISLLTLLQSSGISKNSIFSVEPFFLNIITAVLIAVCSNALPLTLTILIILTFLHIYSRNFLNLLPTNNSPSGNTIAQVPFSSSIDIQCSVNKHAPLFVSIGYTSLKLMPVLIPLISLLLLNLFSISLYFIDVPKGGLVNIISNFLVPMNLLSHKLLHNWRLLLNSPVANKVEICPNLIVSLSVSQP